VARGVACGDLFNDGRIDIVVEMLKGQPVILQPQAVPANHWISFQLEGTQSNHLALNARVKITSADLVQTGQVLSGGSYLSQDDLRIHFGLGAHERVDKAEVIWPSGKVEILTNLAVDRFYKLKEGQGVISADPPAHPAPRS
jgi:enediyne biosynthesis protein E4